MLSVSLPWQAQREEPKMQVARPARWLREDCVEGALERGLTGRERGVRGGGQQRCVGLAPGAPRHHGSPGRRPPGGRKRAGLCSPRTGWTR